MTPLERVTGRKPNLNKVLEFGVVIWVKVKNANKLEPQAVEGHFVGYDEKSKGYRVYFPKWRSMIVERDMYFDKDAIVDVGKVVFEGEMESTNLLNPTGPEKAPTSVPKTDVTDAPETTEMMPISVHITPPLIPTKPRWNSLTGLPQYNPQE